MEPESKSKAESSKSTKYNKDKNKERVSVRFHLQLTDSTDRSFPQFSYVELLGTNKSKKKDEDKLHDGECNVDELKALAKKFEDKYGPKSTTKKPIGLKTDRYEDLVDVTYGYDATDSFVDDSEAYDELVPADWTTEHGGFYINMGELNFRPVSSGDEKSDGDFKESKKKKTPKKKNKESKEKKLKDGKRLLSSSEKEKTSKKMRLNSEVKDGKLQKLKKRIVLDGTLPKVSKDIHMETSSQQQKPIKNIAAEDGAPLGKMESNNISVVHNTTSNSGSSIVNSSLSKENENNSPSVSLPDGLPPSLILSVQKLIEAARKAGGEAGKCKFFNSDVNRILLQIETDSRKLNCRARSAVYDYLALFLPCTKDTLLKRAKNLFMQEQVGRLREPLVKLRLAIEAVMPAQIKNYEEEVSKLSEEQALQSQKATTDIANQSGEKKEDTVVKVEPEHDREIEKNEESTAPTDGNVPATSSEDKGKRTVLPKRFFWRDDIRNLLCDVVSIKVELYLMSKSRSTTAEEALKGYLETEVRPLWPKGWMTTRILYRESKQAHAKVTSTIVAKVKKDPKRPNEGKSFVQQVTPMIIDEKSNGGLKNTSTCPVALTNDSSLLKNEGRPAVVNISSNKQTNLQGQPSAMLKTAAGISDKIHLLENSKKSHEDTRTNMNQRTSGMKSSQERINLPTTTVENDVKPQMIILQPQNKSAPVVSRSKAATVDGSVVDHSLLAKAPTVKSDVQTASFPSSLSSLEARKDSQDHESLKSLKVLSVHDHSSLSNPSRDNPSHSSSVTTHDPAKQKLPHLQNQNIDKVGCKSKDDEGNLSQLLGEDKVLSKDNSQLSQSNLKLVYQTQNQSSFNDEGRAMQNSQKSSLHSSGKQIKQENNQIQNLSHVLNMKPDQFQSVVNRQSEFESQSLSHPEIQRTHASQLHGQTQGQGQLPGNGQGQFSNKVQGQFPSKGQFLGQSKGQFTAQGHAQFAGQSHQVQFKREDQGHPLPGQTRTQSPKSPHVTPARSLQGAYISPTKRNQSNAAGKTILDYIDEISPPQSSSNFNNGGRSFSHSTTLSPCSFQNAAAQHQISPPRNIMAANSLTVTSPRPVAGNISPQISSNTANFSSPTKRLSSCSLQNIPSKMNQEPPRSLAYSYKVPASANLNCQFPMQSTQSSPDTHQRTHPTNFMSSSDNHNSLLNSLNDVSSNRISPSIPLVGQLPNHLQNVSALGNNPITIPPIMNIPNNISNNKSLPAPANYPLSMNNYGGMQRHQFPTQQPAHRNNLSSDLNDGNNRIPNYPPPYRPFS